MNEADARALVERYLERGGGDAVTVLEECLSLEIGWVFFYQSTEFLRTRVNRYRLAGNAPILISRDDGSLHVLGTAEPLEHYLEEFAKKRAK